MRHYGLSRTFGSRGASLVASLLLALGLGACGSDLGSSDIASVTFGGDDVTGQEAELELAARNGRQSVPTGIGVESTGAATLKITDVELIDRPERLVYKGNTVKTTNDQGEETELDCTFEATDDLSNDASGACGANQYCQQEIGKCRSRELPETPIEVKPGGDKNFEFQIAATPGTKQPGCPEPSDSVPDTVGDRYCGAFRIETNTQTTNSNFDDGTGRIYLTNPSGRKSGEIAIEPNSMTFENVGPGFSASRTLTISNTADAQDGGVLEVEDITVRTSVEETDVVDVSTTPPIEIPPGESESLDVEVNIPDGRAREEIPRTVFVELNSTAINTGGQGLKTLTVGLETSAEAGPALEVSEHALSFGSAMTKRTVELSNTGEEPLSVTNFQLEKLGDAGVPKNEFYGLVFDGQSHPLDENLPASLNEIAPGETKPLEITYNGSTESGMARLVINADDPVLPSSSGATLWDEVLLLGKKDGPVGEVVPESLIFPVDESPTIARRFVLRNLGTRPLEVGKSWQTPSNGSGAPTAFEIPDAQIPASGDRTIDPGNQVTIAVEMVEKLQNPVNGVSANLPSNTVGETISVNVGASQMPDVEAKIAKNFADESITVGDTAEFTGQNSQSNKNGDSISVYQWYVLDRPATSGTFNSHTVGPTFQVRPDAAGTYKVGLSVTSTQSGVDQSTTSFVVVSQ